MELDPKRLGLLVILVLKASRLLGVSPQHFGPCGSIERPERICMHSIYSIILITTLNVTNIVGLVEGAMTLCAELELNPLNSKYKHFLTWIMDWIFTFSITNIGAYTARTRVKCLLAHIDKMEKVKLQLGVKEEKYWWMKKDFIVSVLVWMTAAVHHISTLILGMIAHVQNDDMQLLPLFTSGSYMCFNIIRTMLTQQMLILLFSVYASMETLVDEFKRISDNIYRPRPLKDEEETSLRIIGRTYVYIHDLIGQLNTDDGWLILIMLVSEFMFIVFGWFDIYWILYETDLSDVPIKDIVTPVMWNIVNMTLIVTLVEPCHQFQKQVERMRVVLARLMYRMQSSGESSALVVDVLYKQLVLDAPAFTPLGVCTVSRSLSTTVISAAVTTVIYIADHRLKQRSTMTNSTRQ